MAKQDAIWGLAWKNAGPDNHSPAQLRQLEDFMTGLSWHLNLRGSKNRRFMQKSLSGNFVSTSLSGTAFSRAEVLMGGLQNYPFSGKSFRDPEKSASQVPMKIPRPPEATSSRRCCLRPSLMAYAISFEPHGCGRECRIRTGAVHLASVHAALPPCDFAAGSASSGERLNLWFFHRSSSLGEGATSFAGRPTT